ncbi:MULTISPECIES: hypothetical protein [Halorussus]|uniref:hypothetical protein n=1 Tax=Halorussus TaxID=1070314 RepID=UPI0013B45D4D|nr:MULTISPECIES: hypothetical protein [Halorussus]NHN58832.1 hypothetical protein [Halorussus sp. JP-T4]
MSRPVPAVLALVVAFVLGAIVGPVGGVGFGLDESDDAREFDSPGLSLSKSVGACDDVDSEPGWVHDVAVGESFAVTLETTVVHDWNRTVTANVSRVSPGRFLIDLRTVPADSAGAARRKANASAESTTDCAATDLSLGTSLPTDYEEFAVAVNGRPLVTVEYDGTVADLHRLPNPTNATSS